MPPMEMIWKGMLKEASNSLALILFLVHPGDLCDPLVNVNYLNSLLLKANHYLELHQFFALFYIS